eukprot:4691727-Prymnesium_polylepis.1
MQVAQQCQAAPLPAATQLYQGFVRFSLQTAPPADAAPAPAKGKGGGGAVAAAAMSPEEAAGGALLVLGRVQSLDLNDVSVAQLSGARATGAADGGAAGGIDWGDDGGDGGAGAAIEVSWGDDDGAAPEAKAIEVSWGDDDGAAAAAPIEVSWGDDDGAAAAAPIEVSWGDDDGGGGAWDGVIEIEAGGDASGEGEMTLAQVPAQSTPAALPPHSHHTRATLAPLPHSHHSPTTLPPSAHTRAEGRRQWCVCALRMHTARVRTACTLLTPLGACARASPCARLPFGCHSSLRTRRRAAR